MAQNFVRSIQRIGQHTKVLLFCYQNNYVMVNWLGIVSTFKQLTEIPCYIKVIRAEMFNRNIIQKDGMNTIPLFKVMAYPGDLGYIH